MNPMHGEITIDRGFFRMLRPTNQATDEGSLGPLHAYHSAL
jgi:hypothetical protein